MKSAVNLLQEASKLREEAAPAKRLALRLPGSGYDQLQAYGAEFEKRAGELEVQTRSLPQD
jgi:hypothetical protein